MRSKKVFVSRVLTPQLSELRFYSWFPGENPQSSAGTIFFDILPISFLGGCLPLSCRQLKNDQPCTRRF